MAITEPGYDAAGDVRIGKVHHGRRDDQDPWLWAAVRGAVIEARKIRVAAMERLPVRNTKWAPPRSPLIDRNRGSDAEQIGQTQDTGHLRARIMHDANFVCSFADIALSLPVKTLTLPAIETSEGADAS